MSFLDSFLEDELLASELRQPVDFDSPHDGLRDLYLAIRTDGDPGPDQANPRVIGNGTRENPFAANTAAQFNFVLRTYGRAQSITVHLGPGLFRTEGGGGSNSLYPFFLRDGMRIVGAGMFNTTLRLAAVPLPLPLPGTESPSRSFTVIGGDLNPTYTAAEVEISDLTIDCNLGDQPWTPAKRYAWMSLMAVNFNGSGNRLRRVRLINFGTRTHTSVGSSAEAYPFWGAGGNYIAEDCVVEQPFLGCGRGNDRFSDKRSVWDHSE
jgi:hypothetical protein